MIITAPSGSQVKELFYYNRYDIRYLQRCALKVFIYLVSFNIMLIVIWLPVKKYIKDDNLKVRY